MIGKLILIAIWICLSAYKYYKQEFKCSYDILLIVCYYETFLAFYCSKGSYFKTLLLLLCNILQKMIAFDSEFKYEYLVAVQIAIGVFISFFIFKISPSKFKNCQKFGQILIYIMLIQLIIIDKAKLYSYLVYFPVFTYLINQFKLSKFYLILIFTAGLPFLWQQLPSTITDYLKF